MSWGSYVENMMGSKTMTSCGIFGLDSSLWAKSNDFPVSTANYTGRGTEKLKIKGINL